MSAPVQRLHPAQPLPEPVEAGDDQCTGFTPRPGLGLLVDALVDAVARRVVELQASPDGPGRGTLVEPWVDADQAAEHLACNRRRIYDLVAQRATNGIPVRKEGGRLLFRRSELDRWIERGGR